MSIASEFKLLLPNGTAKSHRKKTHNAAILIAAFLVIVCLLFTGCISAKQTPDLARIFAGVRARTGKTPVIIIPGILGTQLINPKTGQTVWPSVFRSSDDGSTLPMSPDLSANHDGIVPGKIVETLRLGKALPEVNVYRDLLEALRRYAGYRPGEWTDPPPDGDRDTYYVFSYDWRLDNVENARAFVRRVEELKRKLNRSDLRFNVLAHSMGGLIARYAVMYGDSDIVPGSPPSWKGAEHISKIIMFGVPNEGTADAFATLLDGYSITEGLRRRIPLLNRLTAQDAVRSPALFQLLPHEHAAKFLDEELKPLEIDLYNPEVWRTYGWSVIQDRYYRAKFARESSEHSNNELREHSLRTLDAYLAAVLKRAKDFHDALDFPSKVDPRVTLLAIGGDCEETLEAPIIHRDSKSDRWETLIRPKEYRTASGRRVTKREATEAMYAPGDGRVTRSSLLGENLPGPRHAGRIFDSPLGLTYAVFGCDLHGSLQKNKVLADNALTVLVNEAMR